MHTSMVTWCLRTRKRETRARWSAGGEGNAVPRRKGGRREHRDRLARFGVEYIEAALQAQGRSLVVAEAGEQKLDLVQDFIDVVTSMCARIYGRRAASNRAKKALAAAAEAIP